MNTISLFSLLQILKKHLYFLYSANPDKLSVMMTQGLFQKLHRVLVQITSSQNNQIRRFLRLRPWISTAAKCHHSFLPSQLPTLMRSSTDVQKWVDPPYKNHQISSLPINLDSSILPSAARDCLCNLPFGTKLGLLFHSAGVPHKPEMK